MDHRRHLIVDDHILLFAVNDNTLGHIDGSSAVLLAICVQIDLQIWCDRILVVLRMVVRALLSLLLRRGILGR